MPPASSKTRQANLPERLSTLQNPAPAWTYTWSPNTSGEQTNPNDGKGDLQCSTKSNRHRCLPVWASRHTKTSRIPAT